jgi:hypothetical protein
MSSSVLPSSSFGIACTRCPRGSSLRRGDNSKHRQYALRDMRRCTEIARDRISHVPSSHIRPTGHQHVFESTRSPVLRQSDVLFRPRCDSVQACPKPTETFRYPTSGLVCSSVSLGQSSDSWTLDRSSRDPIELDNGRSRDEHMVRMCYMRRMCYMEAWMRTHRSIEIQDPSDSELL